MGSCEGGAAEVYLVLSPLDVELRGGEKGGRVNGGWAVAGGVEGGRRTCLSLLLLASNLALSSRMAVCFSSSPAAILCAGGRRWALNDHRLGG